MQIDSHKCKIPYTNYMLLEKQTHNKQMSFNCSPRVLIQTLSYYTLSVFPSTYWTKPHLNLIPHLNVLN